MVVRISTEIEHNLIELGSDGRLVRLQLEELMVGVEDDRRLLITDYLSPRTPSSTSTGPWRRLAALDDDALFDDEPHGQSTLQPPRTTPAELDEASGRPSGVRLLVEAAPS